MAEKLHAVDRKTKPRIISALSLDGGGIRGLILSQVNLNLLFMILVVPQCRPQSFKLLIAIEELLDRPLSDYFDWTGSTSTGSCIGATHAVGECWKKISCWNNEIMG